MNLSGTGFKILPYEDGQLRNRRREGVDAGWFLRNVWWSLKKPIINKIKGLNLAPWA